MTNSIQAIRVTENEIRNAEQATWYNQGVWDKVVDGFTKYKDVQFYKMFADQNYSYDRYYAAYTLPTGLRLFNVVRAGGVLTDRGFCEVIITDLDYSDLEPETLAKMENINTRTVITVQPLISQNGQYFEIKNTPEARKIMTKHSVEVGVTFTNVSVY